MIHAAVIAASGAVDRGVVTRSDLSGFNWSAVPTVLVEMGFMSNASEDRALNTDAYQDKLARGLADGIVEYLRSRQ
jgi:N-acetylmuramoyl-L-alanine amidase